MSRTTYSIWKYFASVLLVSDSIAQNIFGADEQISWNYCPANETTRCGECQVFPGVEDFLQESLFPFVPPTIKFSREQLTVPIVLGRYLNWKWISVHFHYLVEQVLKSSGFTIATRTHVKNEYQWLGSWGSSSFSPTKEWKTIRSYQKLNKVPDGIEIGDKVRMQQNLRRGMRILGKQNFEFLPEKFILPDEMEDYKQVFNRSEDHLWLLKTPKGYRCNGIQVIRNWEEIPNIRGKIVAEKFLTNPYLIDGRKVELRIFVLTAGYNPLRIYIADDYIVKGARLNYTHNSDDICLLITQYALYYPEKCPHLDYNNLFNRQLRKTELFTRLTSDGLNVTSLEEKLADMVVKTLLSGLYPPAHFKNLTPYNAFQFLGIDVLIDESGDPILLEFNQSPFFQNKYPTLQDRKKATVADALNLLGFHLPPTMSTNDKEFVLRGVNVNDVSLETPTFDERLYQTKLSSRDKAKQRKYRNGHHSDNTMSILEDLTPDDVRQLILAEDELNRAGNFKRVYPSIGMENYMPLSRFDSYYDMLFYAWETKYHQNRAEGIHRLQLLAAQKFHLNP